MKNHVTYYWYTHGIYNSELGQKIIDMIRLCLDTHDYEKFMFLRETLNVFDESIEFLPSVAYEYIDDDNFNLIDVTKKENFNKITEYFDEHG